MIYQKYARMVWPRQKCYIEDGKIVAFKAATDNEGKGYFSEGYNPFDFYGKDGQKNLYLRFIEIDEKDPEQIRQFVEQFGFLGLRTFLDNLTENHPDNFNFEAAFQKAIKQVRSTEIYLVLTRPEFDYETIEDFAEEVVRMRKIVKLYAAVMGQDRDGMVSYLEHDSSSCSSLNDLTETAKFRIVSEININVDQQVSPWLSSGEGKNFSSSWVARNLLSAMYAMFYMDILKGVEIRECRNPTCRQCFTVNVHDKREAKKVYCSHGCVAAVAQREYRKKAKEKKEAQS